MALLEVESLTKSFAGRRGAAPVTAVNDVSFSLNEGSAFAIVGESGSGKSTTARIVAGLEVATSGSIRVDGMDWTVRRRGRDALRTRAGTVQMVFQDPYGSLNPRQTVGQGIQEILASQFGKPTRWCRDRAAELLDQVGVDPGQASRRPSSLSGGQRQRVAIARALALEPRILILDEPVSALDVSVQAQVLNLLVEIRRNLEISYLFVSHDLAVVRQVTDECLVMRDGRIVERGPTAQVLDHPTHPYTQVLLDAVPRIGWVPQRQARPRLDKAAPLPSDIAGDLTAR